VLVAGRVAPYVSGQWVRLTLRRAGRKSSYKAKIRGAGGGRGWFVVRFRARGGGLYRISARHKTTAKQAAFGSRSRRVLSVTPRAGYGARGPRVRVLQRLLRSLGFPTGRATGYFGGATARAVLAFRKTNRMGRGSYAGPVVFYKLFRRQGRFRLRYPRAGRHVEFDWSRQVLVLASRGRARRVYHASSGKPSTPTVFGTFRFYRKDYGTNSLGMVHSSYFFRGYAIHGYRSVPNYPASHGCIRVPIPNALSIYRWIRRGQLIFVYR
jgi:hypothetical protein